ncbi:hypothetical protein AB0G32_33865 [Streptomyces sp. NPDC023723]|uniref:hypothetical protein n=1 Tax=Streptomyces sp. NPDC023723 TaxID=3154323 RepID=UPI0033EE0F47
MFTHELFREKLTADLVRAGLPIAPTASPSLSSGVYLETIDDSTPPAVFLQWRVHSALLDHFLSLGHAELTEDPQVRTMLTAQRAMYTAITTVLEHAGYEVREATGERAGELVVSQAER